MTLSWRRAISKIRRHFMLMFSTQSIFEKQLSKLIANQCASYVILKMADALDFSTKEKMWDYCIQKSKRELLWEFGVCKAYSINYFAKRIELCIGFDSFFGLEEDWKGHNLSAGSFSMHGKLPKTRKNVKLHAGWFKNTLPTYLEKSDKSPDIIHIDCDTYESSAYVLNLIVNRIHSGSIIIFDEYLNYRGWKNGEFRAWREIVQKHYLKYQYLAFCEMSVAVQIQ